MSVVLSSTPAADDVDADADADADDADADADAEVDADAHAEVVASGFASMSSMSPLQESMSSVGVAVSRVSMSSVEEPGGELGEVERLGSPEDRPGLHPLGAVERLPVLRALPGLHQDRPPQAEEAGMEARCPAVAVVAKGALDPPARDREVPEDVAEQGAKRRLGEPVVEL